MPDRGYVDPDEMYDAAVAILNGEGGDLGEAARLLAEASGDGHLPSKRVLGFLYLDGRGVERDLGRAYELISEAATSLDPLAMYALGRMYEAGLGVEQSDKEALYMFAIAAEMGIPPAREDAERIMARLMERIGRKLRSRPILNLDVSDEEIEAVCCKAMLDAALSGGARVMDTYRGPELVCEGEDGAEAVCSACPFCGKRARKVPHDKIY
ncbi:MAG: sel1 repeat family protein [Methanomassiliicoccaceae archaeon]|nr:sel1 repeat family protein [Methanomassiliicoccaceae archaeon]